MRTTRLGALGLSAALILGLALPAAAETKGFTDPLGDSVDANVYRPAFESLDISGVTVAYDTKTLTVTIRFAQLSNEMWSTVRVSVDTTGKGTDGYLMMARHLGSVGPGAPLTANGSLIYVMTGPGGASVGTTDAPKFTVAQTAGSDGTITFTVPASVIKNPKSVRVAVLADLSDGGYTRFFTVDKYPNDGWSSAVSASKATATPTKVKPTISLNSTSVKKGKAAKLTIAVKQQAAGSATIYDGKTALKTVSFAKKTAEKTVTLPKSLAVGKHQITVKFVPKGTKFATGKSAKVTLTVK